MVDHAVNACQKTLASGNKEPLIDRLRNMVTLFQKNFSVPLECIEKYMGYKLDVFTEMDGITLSGIYTALKEGAAKREDYFDLPKHDTEPEPEPPKKASKKVTLNDL